MAEAAGEVVVLEMVENLRVVPYETHQLAVRHGTRVGPLEFIRRKRSPPIPSQRVTGPDGQGYVLTWERFWDDRPNGAIRVIVEGQSEATLQTWSEDFIVAPDGSFVGPVKVTRADWGLSGWELQPMESARRIPYGRRLSAEEANMLIRGFHPCEMEDHWFIFEEDGVVHLHRSWTGIEFCAFQLHPLAEGGSEITEVMVNEASEEIEDDLDEFETRSAHILDVFFDSMAGTPWPDDLRENLERHMYGFPTAIRRNRAELAVRQWRRVTGRR